MGDELSDDLKVLACWVNDGDTLSKTWSLEAMSRVERKDIYF